LEGAVGDAETRLAEGGDALRAVRTGTAVIPGTEGLRSRTGGGALVVETLVGGTLRVVGAVALICELSAVAVRDALVARTDLRTTLTVVSAETTIIIGAEVLVLSARRLAVVLE
jgi:hypothetical protein